MYITVYTYLVPPSSWKNRLYRKHVIFNGAYPHEKRGTIGGSNLFCIKVLVPHSSLRQFLRAHRSYLAAFHQHFAEPRAGTLHHLASWHSFCWPVMMIHDDSILID
jgi:hypothetical protein